MQFHNWESLVNPCGSSDVHATSVPLVKFHPPAHEQIAISKPRKSGANAAKAASAANANGDDDENTEQLQIFMDALFTGLRDDPAAIASVDRITREIQAAEALAKAAAGCCPKCGAPAQHQQRKGS